MIWIFTTSPDDYLTVARGVLIRSFHNHKDKIHVTWAGQCRQLPRGAHTVCTGDDNYFRPGRAPHVDTIWPAVRKTLHYSCERGGRPPYSPWDDVPWEIHLIDDDSAREAAYRTFVGDNRRSSDYIKKLFVLHLPQISMSSYPALVQEHT